MSIKSPGSFWEKLVRWRWWLFVLGCVVIILLEIYEHASEFISQPMFYIETLSFAGMLLIIALLLEILLHMYNVQTQSTGILRTKYELGQKLETSLDGRQLGQNIIETLVSIVQPAGIVLTGSATAPGHYEEICRWGRAGEDSADDLICQLADVKVCPNSPSHTLHLLEEQAFPENPSPLQQYQVYCYPLKYGYSQVGLLRFLLPKDRVMTPQQVKFLENINNEIAVALMTAQQRKVLAEYRAMETALAERRNISNILHDTLGQNLAYLRLKLDELNSGFAPSSAENRQADLQTMLSAADDSLALVRDLVANLRYEPVSDLENALQNIANKISKRSNVTINVNCDGQSQELSPDIQEQVLSICREALSNIEKHAVATSAEVMLQWDQDEIVIRIEDDGIGFDPDKVDISKHFGLSIVRERIAALEGELRINSTHNSGTEFYVWLPL